MAQLDVDEPSRQPDLNEEEAASSNLLPHLHHLQSRTQKSNVWAFRSSWAGEVAFLLSVIPGRSCASNSIHEDNSV